MLNRNVMGKHYKRTGKIVYFMIHVIILLFCLFLIKIMQWVLIKFEPRREKKGFLHMRKQ